MKKQFVSDLKPADSVDDVFMAGNVEIKMARGDSPFIKMSLSDKTGSIEAVKWAASENERATAQSSPYLMVTGRVETYNGKNQMKLDSISRPSEEPAPEDFLAVAPDDPETMRRELMNIIRDVRQPQVRQLLELVVGESPTGQKFSQSPAAMRVHHAYIGGLLEHTLSVVRLVNLVADHYPEINRDLLTAGAILHDVGKIEEYDWQGTIKASDSGGLLGHITQGAILVNKLMDEIGDFPEKWRMLITHMIISHHGKLEFGSPKIPAIREALILHYIEDMDAKLQIMTAELKDVGNQGMSANWTKRSPWLDTAIFRDVPPNTEGSPETAPPSVENGSQKAELSLFEEYDPFQ